MNQKLLSYFALILNFITGAIRPFTGNFKIARSGNSAYWWHNLNPMSYIIINVLHIMQQSQFKIISLFELENCWIINSHTSATSIHTKRKLGLWWRTCSFFIAMCLVSCCFRFIIYQYVCYCVPIAQNGSGLRNSFHTNLRSMIFVHMNIIFVVRKWFLHSLIYTKAEGRTLMIVTKGGIQLVRPWNSLG